MISLLFTIFATAFCCYADTQCTIYNSGGAIAKVDKKGGQASGGTLYVPVSISNLPVNYSKGREIDIWVEIVDQNKRCVVKRVKGTVWVKSGSSSGSSSIRVEGLESGKDYLFQVDTAKLCE